MPKPPQPQSPTCRSSTDEQSLDEIPDALASLNIKREPPAEQAAAEEVLLRRLLLRRLLLRRPLLRRLLEKLLLRRPRQ